MAGRTTGLSDVVSTVRDAAAKNPASERLLKELESYLGAQAQRVVGALGNKIGETTRKLGDVSEGTSDLGGMLGGVAQQMASGAGPGKAMAKAGLKEVGEKVKSMAKGGGSSGGKKSMNIIEDINVGVPVRTAYNQWSMLQDIPKWSKGAQSVNQEDEVKSNWKAKIAFSTRNWNASITEMVPDERIAWTSEGPKGVVNGAVTFHPLGDRLTKVLLVLDYFPGGFFEKTANLWRAQGRRARLDLKFFRRFVMTNPDAGQEGWRGEIRDGEVVRDHDEVVAEEEKAAMEKNASHAEREQPQDEGEDREDEDGERDEAEQDEDREYDEAEQDEDREYDEAEYDEDEEDEEEEEPSPPPRRRPSRQPAPASRRR